jgi:hypothetical protein
MMALQKEFEIRDSGITADYLKVEDFQYTKENDEIRIHIGLYKDKAARDAGKSPIDVIYVRLASFASASLSGANIMEMLYNQVKALPEMSGAVDV